MTLTLDQNCLNVVVASDLITNYIPGVDTLELDIYHNCDEGVTITIDENNIVTNTVTLEPSDLNQSGSKLEDGVYRFVLTLKTNNPYVVETLNLYVYCDLECDLITYYSQHFNSNVGSFHEALKRLNACGEFTYDRACLLWAELERVLDKPNTSGCGCD